jgi:BirA family transcriptional regulator, biotin operon repressor / biotin---[acetyl-CoA-carboxylase] ligase
VSALGRPRLHLARTDSTNLRARELAAAGAPHGTLVTAAEQTAGRGRQGRGWSAPPGRSLLMSLLLRDPPPQLSLRAGVAVAEVARSVDAAGRETLVKWPNDVLVGGGKVAGILVEGRPQEGWSVLGIGLNVALGPDDLPAELRARAATLGLRPGDVEGVLGHLLVALERWLAAAPGLVAGELRARDALRGRPVRWAGGDGTGAGIDDDGRLRVDTGDGVVTLDAGEVHLLGETGPR